MTFAKYQEEETWPRRLVDKITLGFYDSTYVIDNFLLKLKITKLRACIIVIRQKLQLPFLDNKRIKNLKNNGTFYHMS